MFINFLVLFSVLQYAFASKRSVSVNYKKETNKFEVVEGFDTTADAYGSFYPNLNGSGWNYLDANMQKNVISTDDYLLKSRGLGFLEGYSTCETIYTFYPNFYSAVFGDSLPGNDTLTFLQDNYDWINQMANDNSATDSYWFTVRSIIQQLNGVYEGFVAGCGSKLNAQSTAANPWSSLDKPTLMHFLLINAWGDLYQITMKFREVGNPVRLALAKLYQKKFEDQLKAFERCSAIIKILDGYSDVVFGHATWDTYESLGPRILKRVSKPVYESNGVLAAKTSDVYFSSSPAILSSVDDFFTVPSGLSPKGLGIIETTNNLYNLRLLDLVVPQSVLSWTRAVASNQLATSGAHWGQLFSRYHSGTYTNQWMAIDFNHFFPNQGVEKGFLTVFEEVPGLAHVEDKTDDLVRDSYWGSYNIPYYEDISEQSGYARLCKASADQCHETAPRALIFREYQPQIKDLDGAKWMLGYNSFQNDTASQNDPCNAIACRGDLYPEVANQGAFGALDVKASSILSQWKTPNPEIAARLGPTTDQQHFFCWSQIPDRGYVHNGQPDCYNFDYTIFPPAN